MSFKKGSSPCIHAAPLSPTGKEGSRSFWFSKTFYPQITQIPQRAKEKQYGKQKEHKGLDQLPADGIF
jgi:hypothetical protein